MELKRRFLTRKAKTCIAFILSWKAQSTPIDDIELGFGF